MEVSNQTERYYELFSLIVNDPRIMPNDMAKALKYTGQGRAPSTLAYHVEQMYEKGISRKPQITLKVFKDFQKTTYFCKKKESRGSYSIFRQIDKDPKITYAYCLSTDDFFLISEDRNLRVENYKLDIAEKQLLFTPIYTIPRGWNIPTNDAFRKIPESSFQEGRIRRITHYDLPWEKIDWEIYHATYRDIRCKFTPLARALEIDYKTFKKHFYDRILPNCAVINYFFPKGQEHYKQAFLKLESKCEEDIVRSLQKLPCTTYVFPLEKSIVLGLFHESIKILMEVLEKMEEKAIIDNSLLFSPLAYSF